MNAYNDVHRRIYLERGRASGQPCVGCGEAALDWAYLYNGDPELYAANGSPYSEDVDCYAPMCRACHRRHDMAADERILEVLRENGRRNGALLRQRRGSDPAFAAKLTEMLRISGRRGARISAERVAADPDLAEKQRDRGRTQGRVNAERLKTDPEYAARRREGSRRSAAMRAEQLASDPEYAEKVRALAKTLHQRSPKRRCLDCDKVTLPGPMALHLRASGHRGYVDL